MEPDPAPSQHHLLANLVQFGRLLRTAGIPISSTQIGDMAEGLAYVDLARRQQVKDVARATLVSSREQLALFDRAFAAFWRLHDHAPLRSDAGAGVGRHECRGTGQGLATTAAHGASPDPAQDPLLETVYTYSGVELLRYKPFAQLTPAESQAIVRLIHSMPWHLEQRRTRRTVDARRGPLHDWRRTLRRSLRYGGEVLHLAHRRRKTRRRPLVVLCDVSGSMQRYSRLLLHFVYAIGHGQTRREAFVFSTRLTRITPFLRQRQLDAALDEIAARTPDMGGGTQIGRTLRTFNKTWARRVLGGGAVVLVVSDGWDRGDPEGIRREMERLRLQAHRLIWLNPHLGSAGYEPLTRGIRAALPYVDRFLPVHNLASLEQLADVLAAGDMNGAT